MKLFLFCLLVGTALADPSLHTTNKDKLLGLQKHHFETSLKHMLSSFTLSSPGFERPGLAKLTKERSDAHWELGLSAVKKYFQRGEGHTYFKNQFALKKIENPLVKKGGKSFAVFYKDQLSALNTTSSITVHKLDQFFHHTHHHIQGRPQKKDGDISLFVEERVKEERETLRDINVLQKTLGKIFQHGVALDIFDRTLL